MIEIMQLILGIPKALEMLFFLSIVIQLNKKYKKLKFADRPQLHRLFIMGLLGWFGYITLDIVIFIIAPISMPLATPNGTYTGYTTPFISLTIANILRDIGLAGALFISWAYFFASFSIKYGQIRTDRIFLKNPITMFLIYASTIILIIWDGMQVVVNDGTVRVNAKWSGLGGIMLLIVVGLFVASAILLASALKTGITSFEDKQERKKTLFIIAGVLLMALGHSYWFLLSQLKAIPAVELFLSNDIHYIIAYWIGHMLWVASPIFIYRGLKDKNQSYLQNSELEPKAKLS